MPSDRSKYGSKSLNLAQLAKASYSVPDGFCISVEAFKDHILKGSREFKNVSASPTILQQYREMTLETPLKPEFERELDVQIQSIVGSASDLLAVRSSAIEEDLSSGSFAGVYSTILDVKGKVIGKHDGIINFTIGQRRGISRPLEVRTHPIGCQSNDGPARKTQRTECAHQLPEQRNPRDALAHPSTSLLQSAPALVFSPPLHRCIDLPG